MLDINRIKKIGLNYIGEYEFNDTHHSYIFNKDNICSIVDDNICDKKDDAFDYTKYCEMQNYYSHKYEKVYRFNYTNNDIYNEIVEWLNKKPEDIVIEDKGGNFDLSHIDNTPLEKRFEDLFSEAYGEDATKFLKKEFAISLENGRNGFVDYIIETTKGNFAVEENGVTYHHPCLIGSDAYSRQLLKQNTLNLLNYKVFRFSTNNLMFKDQTIDCIKEFFGNKENFIPAVVLKQTRKVKLYKHQERVLEEINKERENGVYTSLVVLPTATGKSQIVIEDIAQLLSQNKIKNILIMVPTIAVKNDWIKRCEIFKDKANIEVKIYNSVYVDMKSKAKNHYDYIAFDEAHHAQAANCKKTLQYFNPKYLIGLTATSDRLDGQKLEEIFGNFESKLTLKEAIDIGVLPNVRCYRLISNINLSEVRFNGKDYNYADLEKNLVIDSRNELIVKTIQKYFYPRHNFYKQGIVFCVNIRHCKKLEKLLNAVGIKAAAVYGGNKQNDKIMEDYRNKKIQFLLSCQMISEGWDCPQTEVVIMARPTLSKVLYLQQMGRGLRQYPGKECLYVIDVVDNYCSNLQPWSFNAIFHIPNYKDWGGVKPETSNEYLEILGLSENELSMQEIDVFTFEEKYGDYKSIEQTARELYISTGTLRAWLKKKRDYASLYLPIGSKLAPYFSKQDIELLKQDKKIKDHNDQTILQDFIDFIDENTLTYSFKLVFLINMFKLADKEGEVKLDKLVEEYSSFYINRIKRGLIVDRKGCIYDEEYLKDKNKVAKNLLDNPYEKFERKRFIYHSKDLNIIAFNPILWSKLTNEIIEDIIHKEERFLEEYYQNLGGI